MHTAIKQALQTVDDIILGKEQQIRLAFCCLFAHGHLLIEDLPGMGKTTLAHALAKVFNLQFQRIQFTSDLLPADILGASVFDKQTTRFVFHPGPVFTQFILADEINRATPKTQSALLEAMEERQVTVEGQTRALPDPFFVVATQNPNYQIGTFPLPESQLDRFLMRIKLGYPSLQAERAILLGKDRRELVADCPAVLNLKQLAQIHQAVRQIHVSTPILDYLQALATFTRQSKVFFGALSPRATLGLLHCAQAWAFMQKRDFLVPEDLQSVLSAVIDHRLEVNTDTLEGSQTEPTHKSAGVLLIKAVTVP